MNYKQKTEVVQYTGPLVLNSRSIQQAYHTLSNRDSEGNRLDRKPMPIDELVNLLSFIEACVMTDRIYFDGTLPPADIVLTNNCVSQLRHNLANSKIVNISPIEFQKVNKLAAVCKESAEQASELILSIDPASLASGGIDKPITGDISSFISRIETIYPSNDARKQAASEILFAIIDGKKTFRGSKCIAGILLAQCGDLDLLLEVKEKLRTCADEIEQRYLIAALINRFRTNYISAQGSTKKAAYLANPSIEILKNQQMVLLWKYLFRKIKQAYEDQYSDGLKSVFKGEYDAFPIGFVVLMKSKGDNPFSLFDTALRIREPVFNMIVAKKTVKKRFLHDFSEDEFHELEEHLYGDLYYDLELGEKKHTPRLFKLASFLIPAVIGATAGIALNALVKDLGIGALVAAKVTAASMSTVSKGTMKMLQPGRRYNLYMDNFQRLKQFYSDAVTYEKIGKSMQDRVAQMFGRTLVK